MKPFRTMLLAMVVILAISAVGASAASAGTGSGHIEVTTSVGPAECDLTFDHGGWTIDGSGYSTSISGITVDTTPPAACALVSIHGNGKLYKEAIIPPATTGYASFEGELTLEIDFDPFGPLECDYGAFIDGGWHWADPPTNSVKAFDLTENGSLEFADGGIFCPGAIFNPSEPEFNSLTATATYP